LNQEQDDPSAILEKEDGRSNSHDNLASGMEILDDRSRAILQRRWLQEEKSTLHELADEYGVSAERIRQIEKAAMKKIKTHLVAA